jgi:predicted Zn-dependent protease
MQSYFYNLADSIQALLQGREFFTCMFQGEDSDFVRLNRSAVRQPGTVWQRFLRLELIDGRRHATGTIALANELSTDRDRLQTLVKVLRDKLPHLPEDPHLLYATEVHSSEHHGENRLPPSDRVIAALLEAGKGRDLVGIYAAGGIYAGFANALGQRNWYATYSFLCNWSFYYQDDKAVKTAYAGSIWDPQAFARKVQGAAQELEFLRRPPRTVGPGRQRVYLAPAALAEIIALLGWGGFSLKAHRTKRSPLLKMVADDARLNPLVTLHENTRDGLAPDFQEAGFIKPDRLTLIEAGLLRNFLVSPRSAQEYGAVTNGAAGDEAPESLDMAPGTLPRREVLKRLDTGLYINNLWYLNYSDRPAGRITGMTRFASFLVENGRIMAPLEVMRFDESIYRLLGDHLLELTAERDLIVDPQTYQRRSTASSRLPGALIADFNLSM